MDSLRGRIRSQRSGWRPIACLGLILLLPFITAACGGDDDDSTATVPPAATATNAGSVPTVTPVPATATTAAEPTATLAPEATATSAASDATPTATTETLTLSVYFMRDEKVGTAHRVVPHTLQVAAAAMTALLEGPNDQETEAGLSSEIPEGTELLGVSITDGVATVDLSSEFDDGGGSLSMGARAAQVVYTLTQFPTVQTVSFSINGEPLDALGGEGIILDPPVGRADFEEFTPAIFVEAPAVGDEVSSPMRVWGTGNTFEAAFMVTLRGPDDEIIFEEPAMATSGTGTRGTFDLTFTWDTPLTGEGTLVVWESSAKDGQPINVVEIPVTFGE